jgi:hypothetical protein
MMNAFCASENFEAFIYVPLLSQPGKLWRKTPASNGFGDQISRNRSIALTSERQCEFSARLLVASHLTVIAAAQLLQGGTIG